ncbi:hypothetical protein SODG_000973 [Sodalis praecaptivus]
MEGLTQLRAFDQRDNLLQVIAGLACDANLIALDLRLHLQLAVFNEFNDFLGQTGFDPCLSFASTL